MAEQTTSARERLARILRSDVALGALIALLSILTAFASYESSDAGGQENDANVEGQAILADSNAEYLRANQLLIYDYTMYDGFFIHEGEDEFRAEYYRLNFSEALNAAIEADPENPFSEAYYNEVFALADETYEQANLRFEDAQAAGKKSGDLQQAMLILAVGLSFSAWASLLPDRSQMRLLFAILSLVALVLGLVNLAGSI